MVTEQVNLDVSVFTVKPEAGHRQPRNPHRNVLLSVGELFAATDHDGEDGRESAIPDRPKPKLRQSRNLGIRRTTK